VGNFPQAFSHVALVGTALNLARGGSIRVGDQPSPALQRDASAGGPPPSGPPPGGPPAGGPR
jgi:hypothetical protein